MAFKLFKLSDVAIYDVGKSTGFETSVLGHGMPFVHAGPHITVWWKGKFLCIATKEALKETETIYQEEKLPFDLFPDDWDALITTFLTQGTPFDSQTAIKEPDLQHVVSADTDLAKILNEWMDSGILQKGKGDIKQERGRKFCFGCSVSFFDPSGSRESSPRQVRTRRSGKAERNDESKACD